jgi:hypothetical protein
MVAIGLHLRTIMPLTGPKGEGSTLPSIATMAMMRTVEIPWKSRKDLIRALLMVSQLILMDQSELGQEVA